MTLPFRAPIKPVALLPFLDKGAPFASTYLVKLLIWMIPSEAIVCSDSGVTLLQILVKVAWPCFLWGLGTALGELPPYFVARAATQVRHRRCRVQNAKEYGFSTVKPLLCFLLVALFNARRGFHRC